MGGVFAISHSICAVLAASIYHKQKTTNDEDALKELFNKFERIQTFRSIIITYSAERVGLASLIPLGGA
jgi:hypothetical protein